MLCDCQTGKVRKLLHSIADGIMMHIQDACGFPKVKTGLDISDQSGDNILSGKVF